MKRRILVLLLILCLLGLVIRPAIPVRASATYADKVLLTASLIQYLKLDETSGATAADSSGNGRTGTYSGVTLAQIDAPSGIGGKAGLWDGVNDYISIWSSSLQAAFSGAEGTIAFWYKLPAADTWNNTTSRVLVNVGVDATTRITFMKGVQNNTLYYYYTTSTATLSILQYIASGDWNFLAISWKKSADFVRAYLNNALSDQRSGVPTWAGSITTAYSQIGALNTTQYPFYGYVSQFMQFNRALTDAEIFNLANPNPASPTPTPTLTPVIQIYSTLENGQVYALNYSISIGQIANVIPELLLIVLLAVMLLYKLSRRR